MIMATAVQIKEDRKKSLGCGKKDLNKGERLSECQSVKNACSQL
jgi:hypothetical protein